MYRRDAQDNLGEDGEPVCTVLHARTPSEGGRPPPHPSPAAEGIPLHVRPVSFPPLAREKLTEFLDTRSKPITAWIYFNGTELELAQQTNLIFDIPGGGFICMSPEHHEERTLRWAIRTKLPVIGFDYGKVRTATVARARDVHHGS